MPRQRPPEHSLEELVLLRKAGQDEQRGDWPSPREARQPFPPWPAKNEPMLTFLLREAQEQLSAGLPINVVMLQLAVHAWFEGGIDGYDRGRRDQLERHSG